MTEFGADTWAAGKTGKARECMSMSGGKTDAYLCLGQQGCGKEQQWGQMAKGPRAPVPGDMTGSGDFSLQQPQATIYF